MQVFDGTQPTVPETESHLATTAFKALAQDVVLNNIGQTERRDGKLHLYPADFVEVVTVGELEDGTKIEAQVREFDTVDETMEPHIIEVREVVPYGQPSRQSRYEIDPETGLVFRHDTEPKAPPKINFDPTKVTTEPTPRELGEGLEAMGGVFSDEMARRELEKQAGVNDQPVSLGEIQNLSDLLMHTAPRPLSL